MAGTSQTFDEIHDVVVVGTGAGGMSAALTAAHAGLDVVVIEKEKTFGGGTATSGGAVWVPMTAHLKEVGLTDTREDVMAYLSAILGNRLRRDMMTAFLDAGPEAIAFLEANTALEFVPRAVSPDYRSDLPGASTGGRTVDPAAFDGRQLGDKFTLLKAPLDTFLVFGGMMVNRKDIDVLLGATTSVAKFKDAASLILRFGADRLRYPRGTRLLMGNAMAGRLLKSALDRKLDLRFATVGKSLVKDGTKVSGIVVESGGMVRHIGARRGIVLATGGFPGSDQMRTQLLPHADQHYSMAPAGNTGDGIRMAVDAGAAIDDSNIGNAFWTPVSVMRTKDGREHRFPHLILDRQKPGLIAVDAQGNRFVNEATSYHEFVEAMHKANETTPTIPAWLVCDANFLRKYGLGLARPGLRPRGELIDSGYLVRGDTIAELAGKMKVDAGRFGHHVERMNAAAQTGSDPDFGKGASAYNRYLGDAEHKPNPCLGPIAKAPFYAVRVYPGDIGTAAGIKTDTNACVLDAGGQPIAGLYAVGNDMNSIMAGAYPGAGITLGPALTFGYIAARHMAMGSNSAE